ARSQAKRPPHAHRRGVCEKGRPDRDNYGLENQTEPDSPNEEAPAMKNKVAMRADIEVDEETGKVVAVYFYIRPGRVAETKEYAQGRALADYDRQGNLLGIEVVGRCEVAILDKISRREPAPVKNFLPNSILRQLAL